LQSVSDSRHAASRSGLLHSGAYDRTASGLGSDWLTQQDNLGNTYGQGAQNDLQSQIAQQHANMLEDERGYSVDATARLQAQQEAANKAAYGNVYPQATGH